MFTLLKLWFNIRRVWDIVVSLDTLFMRTIKINLINHDQIIHSTNVSMLESTYTHTYTHIDKYTHTHTFFFLGESLTKLNSELFWNSWNIQC